MCRLISMLLSATLLFSTGCVGHAAALPEPQPAAAVGTASIQQPQEGVDSSQPIADSALTKEEVSPPAPVEPEPEEPYVRVVDPAKPMVALTFDDGPHGTYSNQILDALEANHAVATFFEVGRNVTLYPAVVAREAELGCEIGSHSNVHKNLSKLKKSTLLEDLAAADAAFIAAGVPAPTLVRPPYGAVNKTVRTTTGRSLVTWNIDTEDWRTKDPQKIISYVQGLQDLDGAVILMHSIYESSAQAAAVLIPWLQEQGYQLVTVTELLAYYHGELPQPNTLYGYTYFFRDRTDTPLTLPTPAVEETPPAA